MRRIVICSIAFVAGMVIMAGVYLGLLTWLEGWDYAAFQFSRDRNYVIPIIVAFGVQSALFSVIRFGLVAPRSTARAGGVVMGASGGTSATAMVACCLHHATNVLPILGLSAATGFLARYQQPFLQISLLMNITGIVIMLRSMERARQNQRTALELT